MELTAAARSVVQPPPTEHLHSICVLLASGCRAHGTSVCTFDRQRPAKTSQEKGRTGVSDCCGPRAVHGTGSGWSTDHPRKNSLPPVLPFSFYEVIGVKPLSICHRSSELPPARAPTGRESAAPGANHSHRVGTYGMCRHTGRSVDSQASPDHLLSVVTRRHAPAARMRWTEGRAAPSVRRFPQEPGERASGAHQCRLRGAGPRAVRSSASAGRPRAPRRGPRSATTQSRVCGRPPQCQSGGCAPRRTRTGG